MITNEQGSCLFSKTSAVPGNVYQKYLHHIYAAFAITGVVCSISEQQLLYNVADTQPTGVAPQAETKNNPILPDEVLAAVVGSICSSRSSVKFSDG